MPRNRKIFSARTIKEWSGGEINARKPSIEMEKWVEARINQGMITSIDPSDIPLGALRLAKNARVIFDKTGRRPGTVLFGPSAPDSNAVLKVASLKLPDGSGHTVRFTKSSLYDLQSGAWDQITGTLNGTDQDRFNVANIFDILVFSNNGANPIQVVDFATKTFGDLGDAKAYRYITPFFNRVVGFAHRDVNEVEVGWSGEYGSSSSTYKGIDEWDPLVNETSGSGPLVDSPADLNDFITGGFALTNVMAILREKSLWVAVKQPIHTNPFNFYASVPGIGCDSPNSAKLTSHGLCWLDRRTRTVYLWNPGSQPEAIGTPIERTLINNISTPELVFGSFDPIENAYSVCIPTVGSEIVQVWTFYFEEKAWTYNEYPGISSFDDTELLTARTRIDDLVGTIDQLIGTIDDLSPIDQAISTRVIGRTDGTLVVPDDIADVDAPHGAFGSDPIPYNTELVSGSFDVPENDIYIARVVIEYEMRVLGSMEFYYSKNGGVDFTFGKSFSPTRLHVPQILTFTKVIKCRKFAWKLTASSGHFDILKYEVWVYPSGQSQAPTQIGRVS